MKIDSMQGLLVEELKDLYDAEKQLVRALPKFAKAASDEELGEAFRHHLDQTKGQVTRLEQVFEILGTKAKSRPCKGMKGLVEEGVDVMNEDATDPFSDEAIIDAAQKVEHYEIAGYSSARTLAQALGNKDAAQLLQETLNEEGETDKRLTQIAKRLIKSGGNGGPALALTPPRIRRGATEQAESEEAADERKRAASPRRSGNGSHRTKRHEEYTSKATTDHDQIRRWAEERDAHPAHVRGTGGKGDVGMLRLDFPGYSGEQSLEPITWDEFFKKFDDQGLALVYQEETAGGKKSNFNKLVSRERVELSA